MLSRYLLTLFSLVVIVLMLVIGAGSARADEVFKPTAAITFDGQTIRSFDISFVDPVVGLYLLADRTNKAIDVVDTATNTPVTQLGKGKFTGTAPCTPPAGANDCAGP